MIQPNEWSYAPKRLREVKFQSQDTANQHNAHRSCFLSWDDHVVNQPCYQKHYGNTVKARITKLQEQFVTVKERLGVTGAGLPTEMAIWTHSELMNVWEAIKETCPYWYRLRALIGNRTSVSDHAITNSQGNMDSSVFMTRGRPLEMEEAFGDEGETLDSTLKLNPMPAVRYFW